MFTRDDLIIQVIDVLKLERKNESIHTANRPHHALGYRLEGEAVFTQDGKEYAVKEGQFIHVPPDIEYRQKTTSETIIAVHLDIFNDTNRELTVWTMPDKKRADATFNRLLEIWNTRAPGYRYDANALMYDLFATLRKAHTPTNTDSADVALLQPAMDYLLSHFTTRDLSIPKLAALSSVSEVYFRKIFRRCYHISPLKYIHRLRIAKAAALLRCGGYSVQNVSILVGYTDPLYFSRIFKEHTGYSPSHYAQVNPQGDVLIKHHTDEAVI